MPLIRREKSVKVLFFKIHEGRVMGVGFDPSTKLIYSAGEDKSIKVTSTSEHKILFGSHIGDLGS